MAVPPTVVELPPLETVVQPLHGAVTQPHVLQQHTVCLGLLQVGPAVDVQWRRHTRPLASLMPQGGGVSDGCGALQRAWLALSLAAGWGHVPGHQRAPSGSPGGCEPIMQGHRAGMTTGFPQFSFPRFLQTPILSTSPYIEDKQLGKLSAHCLGFEFRPTDLQLGVLPLHHRDA